MAVTFYSNALSVTLVPVSKNDLRSVTFQTEEWTWQGIANSPELYY
jgi:hypothetical protein